MCREEFSKIGMRDVTFIREMRLMFFTGEMSFWTISSKIDHCEFSEVGSDMQRAGRKRENKTGDATLFPKQHWAKTSKFYPKKPHFCSNYFKKIVF